MTTRKNPVIKIWTLGPGSAAIMVDGERVAVIEKISMTRETIETQADWTSVAVVAEEAFWAVWEDPWSPGRDHVASGATRREAVAAYLQARGL